MLKCFIVCLMFYGAADVAGMFAHGVSVCSLPYANIRNNL